MPLVILIASFGQAPEAPAGIDANREQQMQFLKAQAAEFMVYRAADTKTPLSLKAEPVLRYSNPVGSSSDGATFLWLDGTLPVAAVSFSIRRPNNAVYRECTSFSATPLDCRVSGATVWAPRKGGLVARKLDGAPAPAESEARRLTQMRDIARRFTVTWYHSRTEDKTQLSGRPSPLVRFNAEKHGVLDGALFTFGDSNDPEMLLLLEAFRDQEAASAYWRYSLARMSSLKEAVRLDDQEVWSVPNYHQDPLEDRMTGPYSEARVGVFDPGFRLPQK
jgi:hypothetical protein